MDRSGDGKQKSVLANFRSRDGRFQWRPWAPTSIRLGIIGEGIRGTDVGGRLALNQDCAIVAGCDVAE